jgi:hypothetical protein
MILGAHKYDRLASLAEALSQRGLSREAADQVRREIEDQYYPRATPLSRKAHAPDQVDRQALAALGDAEAVNIRYRSVLLTKEEARMLREVQRDGEFFSCRPDLIRAFRVGPCMLLCVAAVAYAMGATNLARNLLAATLGLGMIFTVPTFSIYTAVRSQVYRYAKWPVVLMALWLANARSFNWLGITLVGLVVFGWTEWVCASLRKKLPVERWPLMLYL